MSRVHLYITWKWYHTITGNLILTTNFTWFGAVCEHLSWIRHALSLHCPNRAWCWVVTAFWKCWPYKVKWLSGYLCSTCYTSSITCVHVMRVIWALTADVTGVVTSITCVHVIRLIWVLTADVTGVGASITCVHVIRVIWVLAADVTLVGASITCVHVIRVIWVLTADVTGVGASFEHVFWICHTSPIPGLLTAFIL